MAAAHARITVIAEGDASVPDKALSGAAYRMVEGLRRHGHSVRCVDAELYGVRRLLTAAACYRPRRAAWRAQYRLGALAFRQRSSVARNGVDHLDAPADVLIQ